MTEKDVYSVVIVDDHLLFAQALENLINMFDDFHVLYHVENGKDFLSRLDSDGNKPDLALLDINMPQMNGIETMNRLLQEYPMVKALALSMDNEENTIIQMLKAVARGYLLKDIHPKTFHHAMVDVMQRGFYYSDQITNTVLHSLNKAESPATNLSEREIEFLKLACTEKTYKEIAGNMFLSPKTIDGYRERLFEKLQVKSRIGLVLFSIKNNLFKV